MKKSINIKYLLPIIITGLLFSYNNTFSQDKNDTAGIKNAALGYIDGWYEGSTEKMSNALHPCLAKRLADYNLTAKELLGFTSSCTGCGTAIENRMKEITIKDITDSMATVKVISFAYIDYLDVAKYKGKWQIVNVLWEYKNVNGSGTKEKLKTAVENYTTAWLTGDKDKMSSVIADNFYSRISLTDSLVENVDKKWILGEATACRECKKNYDYKINVLDTFNNKNAIVKLTNGDSVQYLQVCCFDGVWRIVNVLRNFKYNPKVVNDILNLNKNGKRIENYPNPFNGETVLSYHILNTTDVVIKVFDIFGREVSTLINEKQTAGIHKTIFNGADLRGGTYFCSIKTGNEINTCKIILIK